MIVRLFLWCIFLFLCCACRENTSSRAEELCNQIDSVLYSVDKRDSLFALSADLSPIERYAVLCCCAKCSSHEMALPYLKRLDTTSFPEVKDKYMGFMLLKQLKNISDIRGHQLNAKFAEGIASLLFDMENTWRLSKDEKLELLIIKSAIYHNIFSEYKSAMIIANQAIEYSRQCHTDRETMRKLYQVFSQSYLRLEDDNNVMALNHPFLEEMKQYSLDSATEEAVYVSNSLLCTKQKDYQKAYYWMEKAGKIHNGRYSPLVIPTLLLADSISAATGYIERIRANSPHEVIFGFLAWQEACIRLKTGDRVGYERSLNESIRLFDKFPAAINEIDGCAPSEAYARLLWEKGERDAAIRRMELVRDKLLKSEPLAGFSHLSSLQIKKMEMRMQRVRLLTDYYTQVGHTADALHQALLCDSLQQQLNESKLKAEKRKSTALMYVTELSRNLEQRAIELSRERQKLFVSCFILGFALLGMIWLILHYRQQEKQLNVFYARQKEIEQLREDKQKMILRADEKLSPDEQLFRDLEKQFYDDELFRNPGFSRDDLCRLGGSNRLHVSTCINKYAGTNLNQWINKARIDYALRLIREGETDLQILSEKSGFASLKSFFRSFKQFTNLTPRQYIVREK